MTRPFLPLHEMESRHIGLTLPVASAYLEAARVCFDRHHFPPEIFQISDDEIKLEVQVLWDKTGTREKGAWANNDDATRDGAYACAIAATEMTRELLAVRRADTRTGADYYLAPAGKVVEDLEDCLRLEVSGTDLDESAVRSRLKQKIKQAENGDSNLPAIAAVVGFRVKLIVIQTVK